MFCVQNKAKERGFFICLLSVSSYEECQRQVMAVLAACSLI